MITRFDVDWAWFGYDDDAARSGRVYPAHHAVVLRGAQRPARSPAELRPVHPTVAG